MQRSCAEQVAHGVQIFRRAAAAVQVIDQTVQETGLDAGPVGGHTTDERTLIEIDEPDVRVGRRPPVGVFANRAAVFGFLLCGVTTR